MEFINFSEIAEHIVWFDVPVQAIELFHKDHCMDHQGNSPDDPASDYFLFPGHCSWQ